MKNYLIILVLFIFSQAFAQENNNKISLSFENSSIENVIRMIEEKSNFHFYYVDEWLGEDLVSGSYSDISIDEFLNTVFEGTLLNFYISNDNKIILTKNNIIYDSLPEGFFDEKQPTINTTPIADEEIINAPVFFK